MTSGPTIIPRTGTSGISNAMWGRFLPQTGLASTLPTAASQHFSKNKRLSADKLIALISDLFEAEISQGPADDLGGLIQLRRVWISLLSVEIQVVEPIYRHQVDVRVKNLQAGDEETDFGRLETLLKGFTYGARDAQQMGRQVFFEVEPVIHLFPRDDERVSGFERGYREECDASLILPYETPW